MDMVYTNSLYNISIQVGNRFVEGGSAARTRHLSN
jgi:hypothetical protein